MSIFITGIAAVDVEGKVNALIGRAVMLLLDKSIIMDVADVRLNVPEGMPAILLLFNITLIKALGEKLNPMREDILTI